MMTPRPRSLRASEVAEAGLRLPAGAAHAAASVCVSCCKTMLPICLNAVFAALTSVERRELAETITTELQRAAVRHTPASTELRRDDPKA